MRFIGVGMNDESPIWDILVGVGLGICGHNLVLAVLFAIYGDPATNLKKQAIAANVAEYVADQETGEPMFKFKECKCE